MKKRLCAALLGGVLLFLFPAAAAPKNELPTPQISEFNVTQTTEGVAVFHFRHLLTDEVLQMYKDADAAGATISIRVLIRPPFADWISFLIEERGPAFALNDEEHETILGYGANGIWIPNFSQEIQLSVQYIWRDSTFTSSPRSNILDYTISPEKPARIVAAEPEKPEEKPEEKPVEEPEEEEEPMEEPGEEEETEEELEGEEPEEELPFRASDWAQEELERADELGLIPDELKDEDLTLPITREEFAMVSLKVYEALSGLEAQAPAYNPFADTHNPEVLKAYNVGITNGTGPYIFSPYELLEREQAATMLTRVFKRVTIPGWSLSEDWRYPLNYRRPERFTDDALISPWAAESVYFLAAYDIIRGVGENRFAPRNTTTKQEAESYANATREQAILIALRMVENL